MRPEAKNTIRRAATGIVITGGLLAGYIGYNHLSQDNDALRAAITQMAGQSTPTPGATLTPETTFTLPFSTPTFNPTFTESPTATEVPTETPMQVPIEAIEYTTFANADQVAQVRGGNPENWVLKVEVRDGKDSSGIVDPTDVRYGHTIDGVTTQITLVKNEWMYRGPMTDLKPEYQIPQTAEAIALQLGGNVKPENIRVIRITHDATQPSYAKWMDLWQVEEGTVIGYELMQNHQTIDGSTSGNGLEPYVFNLPPGAVVEAYDDRQTEEPTDDVAATIFNPTGKSMILFVSGATIWPWGDVNALIVEQGNFENGAPGASSSAVIDGKVVKLNVASNVLSPQTAHAIVNVDFSTGRIDLTGFVNNPGKDPVKDEATH